MENKRYKIEKVAYSWVLYAMLRSHRTVKHIWFFADTQSQLKKTKRA